MITLSNLLNVHLLILNVFLSINLLASQADICKLEDDPGPCRAAIKRYFYDSRSRSCKIFYYGGCNGNGNNFEHEEDCIQACNGTSSPDVGM